MIHEDSRSPSTERVAAPSWPASLRDQVECLHERRRACADDVEPRAQQRHAARGKRTARERIDMLLEDNSFVELNQFPRDTVTGFSMERRRPGVPLTIRTGVSYCTRFRRCSA